MTYFEERRRGWFKGDLRVDGTLTTAGVANTGGTPVDTNELVSIVNQFLGQGEQISTDITTVTNGIYKKFGSIDKVTNRTEVVTSPPPAYGM